MTDTLYIIGNGFDRFHGLETSYQSFAFFLQENYPDIYDNLLEYYGFPDIDPDEYDEDDYRLWSDFENDLADLDFQTILDNNLDRLPNYANDDFKCNDYHELSQTMEIIVEDLTLNLCEAFKEFILNIQFPKSSKINLIEIDISSLFLNFNYTDTLEKYYKINSLNIRYIHNKARSNNPIILGHGVNPDSFLPKDDAPPEGLTEEQLEYWREEKADSYDYAYETGKEELLSYFYKSFKKTSEVIRQNESFFDELKNIKKVIVLGHSLSDVDKAYFIKIIDSISDKGIEWRVSYHKDEERDTHLSRLKAMGLKDKQIKLIKMQELIKK